MTILYQCNKHETCTYHFGHTDNCLCMNPHECKKPAATCAYEYSSDIGQQSRCNPVSINGIAFSEVCEFLFGLSDYQRKLVCTIAGIPDLEDICLNMCVSTQD